MSARADIAACIVAFRPDATLISALAQVVAPQVGALYVVNNGGVTDELAQRLRAAGAELVEPGANVGVAEAFNICALKAGAAGNARLLLLDQDSNVSPDMVEALAARLDALAAAGERVAVIGPRIVSPSDFKAPRYFPRPGRAARAGATPVQYLISSGSLIELSALREIGSFRADFFIDAIDTEWCFRAWARGVSCWVADDVSMVHRIGAGVVRVHGFGNATPRQPDFRLYAYVRNQAHCLTLPHIPLAWKARFAAHVARVVLVSWIDRGGRPSFLGAMMQAAWRGLRGKLGPPPGASGLASVE
jgi:rhamnosyltransferase